MTLGRLLCKLGLHRWRFERAKTLPGGFLRDRVTCQRPGCAKSCEYTTHFSNPVNW